MLYGMRGRRGTIRYVHVRNNAGGHARAEVTNVMCWGSVVLQLACKRPYFMCASLAVHVVAVSMLWRASNLVHENAIVHLL